jgi:hypothetical protein
MKLEITRPVIQLQPWAISIEYSHDARVDSVVAVIGHRCSFGESFRFDVNGAWADRIHVPPVALCLGMHGWIAIAF